MNTPGKKLLAARELYERIHDVRQRMARVPQCDSTMGTEVQLLLGVGYDGKFVVRLEPPYALNRDLPWHRVIGDNMDSLADEILKDVASKAIAAMDARVKQAADALERARREQAAVLAEEIVKTASRGLP
jgi:alkylated DNA nucleotide flippase Atl1